MDGCCNGEVESWGLSQPLVTESMDDDEIHFTNFNNFMIDLLTKEANAEKYLYGCNRWHFGVD